VAGVDDWLAVARADDIDDVRERILTGFRDGKPFTPYIPTLALPAALGRVLDFGCGLGRNFPYLTSIAREVTGFDLPPMIERCRAALAGGDTVHLSSDWGDVASQSYDLVVATLVLQHIETAPCRAFLEDFARIAPAVYLLTRVRSDFDVNVLELIAETGRFDAGVCVEVEHDPGTHQLRVLGERTFDEVRRAVDGGHYELILRSR
jgi:SAM-dependent methyltransferase